MKAPPIVNRSGALIAREKFHNDDIAITTIAKNIGLLTTNLSAITPPQIIPSVRPAKLKDQLRGPLEFSLKASGPNT
jgi:hypothetical protein